jgi:hypothetical protein
MADLEARQRKLPPPGQPGGGEFPEDTRMGVDRDQQTLPKGTFVKVRTLKEDLIKEIFESIPTRPGATPDITDKELSLFQIRNHGNQRIELCLPNNLESFADSWVIKLVVAAGQVLQAEYVASRHDVKELPYLAEYKSYLQGMCSAFRQSVEGGIISDGSTGKYHQGFCWVVAQVLQQRRDAGLFKTSFTSPWLAFTGKPVWNADAPLWVKNLIHLVTIAAKQVKIAELVSFLKSPEMVIQEKFTKQWTFQSRALFSDFEIRYMESYLGDKLTKYQEFLARVRTDWPHMWDKIDTTYADLSKDLRAYDMRISAIATVRANAIFRSTKRGKKDICPPGLSREGRLEYLSLAAWIQATNPTGLGTDDRIETKLTQNSDDVAADEFKAIYLNIFKKSRCPAALLNPWLEITEGKVSALLTASL